MILGVIIKGTRKGKFKLELLFPSKFDAGANQRLLSCVVAD
jgi:hypothetical protein